MSHRVEMNKALEQLEIQLARSFAADTRFDGWGDPHRLTRTLASIRTRFDNPAVQANRESVASAISAFRRTGKIPTFTALRYICLGAGEFVGQWILLGDARLWKILRERAEEGELRKQIKCFQGLLRSYWSFPAQSVEPSASSYQGWLTLRSWLETRFKAIDQQLVRDPRAKKPEWIRILGDHRNLLSNRPCDRYGKGLLNGDRSELDAATNGLAIPSGSWVFEEAIYAQIQHSVGLSDSDFQQILPRVLDMVAGSNESAISKLLATRCVASLVSRYARCAGRTKHTRLGDAAIECIGNPWLRRAAWDAHVLKPDGQPDDSAREMVHGWLRERLIKDFFELLSEDRAAERRRLNYWLRFEPAIEDMWFILGSHALESTGKDYVDFKQRARGRTLALSGQTPQNNNAFIMRIGEYVVIEFGITGNACFVFAWDRLPKAVTKKLLSGFQHLELDIATLRAATYIARLVHRDSPTARISWEEKFDDQLNPILGTRPTATPYSLRPARSRSVGTGGGSLAEPTPHFSWSELQSHVKKHGLKVADNRSAGGNYWVWIDNTLPELTNPLRTLGFQYKPGKGWWKE